jgi:hypothetical protein
MTTTATTPVADARRWMAFHSIGVYELLLQVHGHLEDYIGALGACEPRVAGHAVRSLVLHCLSVRALASGGSPFSEEDPFADPFAGLPAEIIAEGMTMLGGVVNGTATPVAVTGYVRALERDLGFTEPAASVRRPDGLYSALRMARELIPLNRASGFPLALPSAWLPGANGGG